MKPVQNISPGLLKTAFLAFALFLVCCRGFCQESIFSGLKNDKRRADAYFRENSFQNALELYLNIAHSQKGGDEICLKIARSYYYLHNYAEAAQWYGNHLLVSDDFPPEDCLMYAEALAGTKNYEEAIKWYGTYLQHNPNDHLIFKKIWQLRNMQYLFEDSLYYTVKSLNINTEYGEMCPVRYGNRLIFMANRKEFKPFQKVDATRNAPFYSLYVSKIFRDSAENKTAETFYEKPERFCPELDAKFHEGPVAFYGEGKKMVYIATGNNRETGTLKLYFAEKTNDKWKITSEFPFNSARHSISSAAISKEGRTLYFSSDMRGGLGGKDLYRSVYIDGEWTKPINLGNAVNTYRDESFPFVQGGYLYFSSNGHAGLGGLDIFKALVDEEKFGEVKNMGYPVNTNHDDFGLILTGNGRHGYFTSNRSSAGGSGDDIYEIAIDLQSYPLVISGVLKYKINGKDSAGLNVLANATMEVIDHASNAVVDSSISDASGKFSFSIPHFSQYKIRVLETDGSETIVSLNIPKYQKLNNRHEIVIVKEAFDRELPPKTKSNSRAKRGIEN